MESQLTWEPGKHIPGVSAPGYRAGQGQDEERICGQQTERGPAQRVRDAVKVSTWVIKSVKGGERWLKTKKVDKV